MTYTYIPNFYSLAEIEQLLDHPNLPNPIVAPSFDEFLTHINPQQDQVIVHSATVFSSLIDLLAATQKAQIQSIEQPWIEQLTPHLNSLYLLATEIHTASTQRGLKRAKEQGKKLGRRFNS